MHKITNKKLVGMLCTMLVLMLIGYLAFNHVVVPAKAEEVTNEKIVYLTEEKYSFTNSDILYLSNKSLCVRYSASGFGADTWYNSAMTCSIILYE